MVSGVDLANAFHLGVRVADLEAAMDELGRADSLTWCSVQEREQSVWTPEGGAMSTPLRFTYSAEGPVHIELLQGQPGTVWDADQGAGLHHTGVWAADVAGSTKALLGDGWALVAAQMGPDGGYGIFTYLQSPSGFIVELVDQVVRARFERWWSGGPLA